MTTTCSRSRCSLNALHRGLCQKHWRLWLANNPVVDAEIVKIHLRRFRRAGVSWTRMATLTGCGTATLQKIVYGNTTRCFHDTAAKIVATPLPVDDTVGALDGLHIPVLGTRRRLRALVALGYGTGQLCELLQNQHVSELISQHRRTHVSVAVARRVTALFNDLQLEPPPPDTYTSVRARTRAARRGWAPPLAWDEDALDDPDGQPMGIANRKRRVPDDFEEIVADHRALNRTDAQIAERLGMHVKSFQRRLHRHGIHQKAAS